MLKLRGSEFIRNSFEVENTFYYVQPEWDGCYIREPPISKAFRSKESENKYM